MNERERGVTIRRVDMIVAVKDIFIRNFKQI